MSTPNSPQTPSSQGGAPHTSDTPQPGTASQTPSAPQAPAVPQAQATAPRAQIPQTAPAPGGQPEGHQRLSTFLKVSIILLSAVSLASISLLFIGDFEGRFERVFSTFVLFVIFVLFTAFDTRRERKSEWYAPVALIANTYILGLLLIVIWMTAYNPFGLLFEIFWKSVLVIAVTRLAILCCVILLRGSERLPQVVTGFAFATSVLTVLTAILFTAPVGVETFNVFIPDLYWRIATATLILAALGLAITLLLRWTYGSDSREAARNQRRAAALAHQAEAQRFAEAQRAQAAQAPQSAPYHHQQPQQAPPAQPQPQQLLPWPTFDDGTPLPAGPDGQPDFSAVRPPR